MALPLDELDQLNQKMLGQQAPNEEPAQAPSMEELDARNQELLSTPQPVHDNAGRVYVSHPEQGIGTVAPDELDNLGAGHRLATREEVQRQTQREENESVSGHLKTFGEGAAQGLTLGGYGAIAKAASPDYRAAMDARAEDNPITSGAGNVTGTLAPALLTGGTGLLGRAAAATPAALAARSAAATTEAVAAKFGGGLLSRVASTALGGAVEGGVVAGVNRLAEEVPNFSVDPATAAQHVLASTGEGLLLGGAVGGGASLAGEGVKAAGRATGRAAMGALDFARENAPSFVSQKSLREMAGESAYKAVVGRTNKNSMKLAERHGGDAAVGQTLLNEGIPLAGSADEILQATSQRADQVGAQLGAKIDQLDSMGGAPIKGSEIMDAIDDKVLTPLRRNVFGQDIANAVENQVGLFRQVMHASNDNLTFNQVRNMRIDLDQTLAKWQQAGPPSPTTQALRDVRGTLEDTFLNAAERRAQSVGVEGFGAEVSALKQRYAHLRLAADQAQEAVWTQAANRQFSLTDNMAGLTGASLAGGPMSLAAGLATASAHRYVRQRGRGIAALALHQLADMAEQKTTLVSMANSSQSRVQQAAQTLVSGAQKTKAAVGRAKTGAIGSAAHAFTDDDFAHAIAEAQELQDPNSDASQQMVSNARQMDMINPGMGLAYAQGAHARAQYINSKVPSSAPSTALFTPPPSVDPLTERKIRRSVSAAMDPQRALERMGAGSESPEDIDAVRTVYPALYKTFQQVASQELQNVNRAPNYETRLRVGYVTGLNTDPAFDAGRLTRMQAAAQMPDQKKAAEAQADAKNQAEAAPMNMSGFKDADAVYAPRADQILSQR